MYHMMESYNEIGLDKIIAQDIASGVGSFFVVALGGTAIGECMFLTRFCQFNWILTCNLFHFLRHHLGLSHRFGNPVHRSCASHRTYFHICDGLPGLSECGNLPHERYFSVSCVICNQFSNLLLIYLIQQHHFLWYNYEKLCGIKYFTKVAYDC